MNRPARSIDIPGASHKAPIPAAARVGGLLCTSAIAGKDPVTNALPVDGVQQVTNAFANLEAVLTAGGASLRDVAKLSIALTDNALREAINNEWARCFPDPHDRPARHITVTELQHGMQIQIEAMAFVA